MAGAGTIRVEWLVAHQGGQQIKGGSAIQALARERGPENASHAARLVPPKSCINFRLLAL